MKAYCAAMGNFGVKRVPKASNARRRLVDRVGGILNFPEDILVERGGEEPQGLTLSRHDSLPEFSSLALPQR